MKGNGRIIAFLAVVVVIVLFVLLNMTLFTVGEVTVQDEVFSDYIDKEAIIESAAIKMDSNIFILSETNATNNIETAFPYLKVDTIERKFPNKVLIHVSMRENAMSIPIAHSNNYALVDTELKVVGKVPESSPEYKAATHIESVTTEDREVGVKLDPTDSESKCLLQLVSVSEGESFRFWHFFKTISFESTSIYITLHTGVCIRLDNYIVNVESEYNGINMIQHDLRMALKEYEKLDEQSAQRRTGYIFFDEDKGWIWNAHDAFVTDTQAHITYAE